MRRTKQQVQRRVAAKAAKSRAHPLDPIVTVTLACGHRLNEQSFGPGSVTVKRSVAQVLLENERNMREDERRFHEPDPPGTIVGAGRRLIRVPGGQFDAYLSNAPVIGEFR